MDEAQHPQLLSAENLNLNKSILVDLVDVDDLEITKTVLSAVKNEKMFLYCNGDAGRNPLLHGMVYARGYGIMETMFNAIKVCVVSLISIQNDWKTVFSC